MADVQTAGDARPVKEAETPATKPTKLAAAMAVIQSQERSEEIARALPKHVPLDRFFRNLANALMGNPQLLDCHPSLIFREAAKLAALGLVLDPALGEAYLVVGWNGRARANEPQVRIGYRGLIKLARQTDKVDYIAAHAVHENDEYEIVLGDSPKLLHKPKVFDANRGPAIGYYAVIKYTDGTFDFEPMAMADISAIRDRSDAWKAFQDGKIKSTPWSTDDGEMRRKTVLRRLLKRVPMAADVWHALEIEDKAERVIDQPAPAALAAPRPRSAAAALDTFAGTDVEEDGGKGAQGVDSGPPAQDGDPGPSDPTAGGGGPPAGSATLVVVAHGNGGGGGKAEDPVTGNREATGADFGLVEGDGAAGSQDGGGKAEGPVAGAGGDPAPGLPMAGAPARLPPEIEALWVANSNWQPAVKWLAEHGRRMTGAEYMAILRDAHIMIRAAMADRKDGVKVRAALSSVAKALKVDGEFVEFFNGGGGGK